MTWLPGDFLKHRLILLSGQEEWPRREALSQTLESLGADADFDTETFDAGEASPMVWIASASTSPFLAERRTAIVRHLLRLDPKEAPGAEFAALPASALIVLVADEEAGDDNRQRRLSTIRAAWEKFVEKSGGKAYDFAIPPKNLSAMLRERAGGLGRKLSEKAAQTMLEMTGGRLSRAFEELDKLVVYTHGADEIREVDVKRLVVPSREWNVFKLVDSIALGQVGEALTQLKHLLGSQNRADDTALSSILPQLSRTFRLVWQAKHFLKAGCSLEAPTPALLAFLPEKHNLTKESPFVQKKVLAMARGLSFEAIEKGLESVCLADARLKGMQKSFSPTDTLERMVLEIVASR